MGSIEVVCACAWTNRSQDRRGPDADLFQKDVGGACDKRLTLIRQWLGDVKSIKKRLLIFHSEKNIPQLLFSPGFNGPSPKPWTSNGTSRSILHLKELEHMRVELREKERELANQVAMGETESTDYWVVGI